MDVEKILSWITEDEAIFLAFKGQLALPSLEDEVFGFVVGFLFSVAYTRVTDNKRQRKARAIVDKGKEKEYSEKDLNLEIEVTDDEFSKIRELIKLRYPMLRKHIHSSINK